MSEHEPECWIVSHSNPLNGCICTELRACQKRLWKEPLLVVSRRAGWNDALIAAREAVQAELGWEEADPSDDFNPHTVIWKFRALAAIDALKEDNDQRSQAEGIQL